MCGVDLAGTIVAGVVLELVVKKLTLGVYRYDMNVVNIKDTEQLNRRIAEDSTTRVYGAFGICLSLAILVTITSLLGLFNYLLLSEAVIWVIRCLFIFSFSVCRLLRLEIILESVPLLLRYKAFCVVIILCMMSRICVVCVDEYVRSQIDWETVYLDTYPEFKNKPPGWIPIEMIPERPDRIRVTEWQGNILFVIIGITIVPLVSFLIGFMITRRARLMKIRL